MNDIVLSVKDLEVSFTTLNGTVKAVRGVSFDLQKQETLAIVGESGSGKSVTTKAITGLLTKNAIVENGSIMYEGQNLLDVPERDYHKIRGQKIGMIFQDPMSSLNPIMKIGKQITEPMTLKLGMSKEEAKRKAMELMEDVGIDNVEARFDQYPFQFSGGMRQRIVIAIALASDPDILICDEPTTALDVTVQAQILDLINEIKAKRNISVIFITHDLGVVASMADRIAVMYAGKFVEEGTTDELFYDPRHPYTWALLSSMPDLDSKDELYAIPGTPPNMLFPPKGDAFALRSDYALEIDFEEMPPMFDITETHRAATWLLHEYAPDAQMPEVLKRRLSKEGAQAPDVAREKKVQSANKILEVKNLSQHFSNGRGKKKHVLKAVNDVSFDVFEGETFGIVGESGCGKTTTGRTIIKLHNAVKGEVIYNGKTVTTGTDDVTEKIKELKAEKKALLMNKQQEDVTEKVNVLNASIRKYKNINKMDRDFLVGVQMIFQDPIESLDPRMTIREIIAEGLEVLGVKNLIIEEGKIVKDAKMLLTHKATKLYRKVVSLVNFSNRFDEKLEAIDKKITIQKETIDKAVSVKEYIADRVAELLRTVGLLDEHATRYPHEFSGGQRQRIGIARALVMNPKIIIADEPISALDVSIQASVINLLKKLQKELGLTIIFIAHDLSVVKYFSDRIAVMYRGKIVEQASSEELFKNPVHPYTKSLLSAVPHPNPEYERSRTRISYDPKAHNYSEQQPEYFDLGNDHLIYASKDEFDRKFK